MESAVTRRELYLRKEGATRRQHTKTERSDANVATTGEFVRLAEAIDSCAAFNPKQWRHVLDKSASVLRHSQSNGSRSSSSLTLHVGDKMEMEREGKRIAPQRPLSREEDTFAPLERDGIFPLVSVTQYLNQPDMVRDILQQAATEEQHKQTREAVRGKDEDVVDPELQVRKNDDDFRDVEMEQDDQELVQAKPVVQMETSHVVLPLLTTMSPRTRRELAHLPPPSDVEMREVESFARSVDHPEFSEYFYRELKRTRGRNACQSALSTGTLNCQTHLKYASPTMSLRRNKRPRRAIKPLNARMELEETVAKASLIPVENKSPVPAVNTQMKMKTGDLLTKTLSKTSNRLPLNKGKLQNRSGSYSRLIQERHHAELQRGATEFQVQETLDEIKQFIPLEVIYACGLGKFASPAQQRAAELLFRTYENKSGIKLALFYSVGGVRYVQSESFQCGKGYEESYNADRKPF
ncbi:hypothetical protein DVH05_026660 [Phytophthora capsici]|nr:hypothetical protein DVH05_026660 [Phytophthora capsici]